MILRVWRLLVSLSLLLFVGAGFLWLRSYWVSDFVHWQSHVPDWVSDSDYVERHVESLDPKTQTYLPVPARGIYVITSRGGVEVWTERQSYLGMMILHPKNNGWHYERGEVDGNAVPQFFWPGPSTWYSRRVMGFQCGADVESDSGISKRFVIVPIAALGGIFAVLPVAELWRMSCRRKLRRHQQAGQCPACGYDLRASKDRCPECGQPIASTADSRTAGD